MSTLALVVAACGGGSNATPTSSGPSAQAILTQSGAALQKVTSFSFDLQNRGGDTPLPGGLGLAMRSASGQLVKPDRLSASIKGVGFGFVLELQAISVGNKAYMTDPLTKKWITFDGGASPVNFFDPATGVAHILESLASPSLTDAGDVYRISGKLPSEAVQFVAGSFVPGAVLQAQLDIGKSDLLLHQATLRGRITQKEPDGIVRTLTLANFNQAFSIEPPV